MRKNWKKVLSLTFSVCMVMTAVSGCGKKDAGTPETKTEVEKTEGTEAAKETEAAEATEAVKETEQAADESADAEKAEYTYMAYADALGTNWNPHSWESGNDATILQYLSSGFCDYTILDSEEGVYQWVWDMADSIEDVTADHQDDLTKYPVDLPEDMKPEDAKEGFVFEFKLNQDAKWENGEPINADDYIYSMKQLLDAQMKNYRANLYYGSETAVAGAKEYYYSGTTAHLDNMTNGAYDQSTMVKGADGQYTTPDGALMYFALADELSGLSGSSLKAYVENYGETYFDMAAWDALVEAADEDSYVPVTDDTLDTMLTLTSGKWGGTPEDLPSYMVWTKDFPAVNYDDTVGCYKVDDYTIRYVTDAYVSRNDFLVSCTKTWLVYEDLYEAGKDTSGKLVTTDYGTSKEKTMSCGPYRIDSIQKDKQIVFVQNENWFGWEKTENGELISMTNFEVDGAPVQQYQTTRIVIDVMDGAAAKQAFLKGELTDWNPTPDDMLTYATSDQLYKIDDSFTNSFFFNIDKAMLKEMDRSKGTANAIVVSNTDFRKAMSLCIDRKEFVTATVGYKPAYALLNNQYFYDIYNDPTSCYRTSDAGMQAVCNLYGVEYGEGAPYATLKDAYKSVNGYNMTEAKKLMKAACDQLVTDGDYTAGDPISMRIGWKIGALNSSDNKQIELLNKYLNTAAEGSGFGKITLEAIGNLKSRYADVVNGEYALGYGAWGGAYMYPFRVMQAYCDSDQYAIHEGACWNPAVETLTLEVEGKEVTKTWKDWSNSCVGNGDYAMSDFETKLQITADLEQHFLEKFYRIPVCGTTTCSMLAYQASYYTENYNVMYGFGGMRLMKYNYTDAEWAEFVSSQGGLLNYE